MPMNQQSHYYKTITNQAYILNLSSQSLLFLLFFSQSPTVIFFISLKNQYFKPISKVLVISVQWLAVILLMGDLDTLVRKVYGNRLTRRFQQGDAHHLYTLFEDSFTQQPYFLRTVQLPSSLHISEGIAQLTRKKYQNLLTPIKIVASDKKFTDTTYLVRAESNIILLSVYLQIKKECRQTLESKFLLGFIRFLVKSYKILEMSNLPLFGYGQIGINQAGEFTICDPSLYFRKENVHDIRLPFGVWIQQIIKDFLELPLNKNEYQQVLIQKLGDNTKILYPVLTYLISGQAQLEEAFNKIKPVKSHISEDNTTITASCADINDIIDRSFKGSFKKVQLKNFRKMGNSVKIFIFILIVGLLCVASLFIYNFLSRNVICEEGYYLDEFHSCQSCNQGCTRCLNSSEDACMKCTINMYLVLNQASDTHGLCLKQCHGYFIRVDVCVRDHGEVTQQQYLPDASSDSTKQPLFNDKLKVHDS